MTNQLTALLAPLFIPSPPTGVWHIFGFPLRAYALCIMAGIVVAVVLSSRRWRAMGGNPETLETGVLLAVPLGIIGARLYHVITDYELYFGPGKHPIDALKIWNGGLGIWGAVALGAVGMFAVARKRKASFPALADACAPGILIAQGIGRVGNYFNQELMGRPTTLPWGLEIDPDHRPSGFEQYATFHPTFLYELIWNFAIAGLLLWLDRRFALGRGKLFVLYVALYSLGRFFVEALRIDTVNHVGGFRLNNYTSAIVFVAAAIFFVYLCLRRPGRDAVVDPTATSGADTQDERTAEERTEDEPADDGPAGDDPSDSERESGPAGPEQASEPSSPPSQRE